MYIVSGPFSGERSPNDILGKPIIKDGEIVGEIVAVSDAFWFAEVKDDVNMIYKENLIVTF